MQDPDANQFPSLDELNVHAGLHICERCHHQHADHLPFKLLEPVEGLQQSGLYCPTSDEFKQYEEASSILSQVARAQPLVLPVVKNTVVKVLEKRSVF